MCKFKTADFYYGAVLSILMNKGITPTLFESTDCRRIYKITTNNSEYILFLKYRSESQENKKENYSSWSFNIFEDKTIFSKYLESENKFYVALVCGENDLTESRLAILDSEQIKLILSFNKPAFCITIKKSEKYFRIPINKNRTDGIKVKCDRFDELL